MPYARPHNKLNDLPLTRETYARLCEVCTFGKEPIGGKVVVHDLGPGYTVHRYRIVSNPIGLDSEHIAYFCDGGNLCFGYRTCGSLIEVYTD